MPVYYYSGAGAGNSLMEGGMFWSLLMIVSFLLQAADTVLKVIVLHNVFSFFYLSNYFTVVKLAFS